MKKVIIKIKYARSCHNTGLNTQHEICMEVDGDFPVQSVPACAKKLLYLKERETADCIVESLEFVRCIEHRTEAQHDAA